MRRRIPWNSLLLSVILTLLFPVLASADPGDSAAAVDIPTLAVMPFGSADKPFDKSVAVRDLVDCKIFGFCTWKREDIGITTVTEIFQRELRKKMGAAVLPLAETRAAFEQMPPMPEETLRTAAKRFGQETMASHVLTGTVWHYRDRVGSAMTAEQPASVGFTAILVRTRDGAVLWSGHFDKTQTSLSDNLFDAPMFLQKGMKWLSAEELASFGVDKILQTFPAR